ncbi:MAG TPA: hypothetical protein VD794_11440, partial [Flavisolibacter sp.]|nr:hypothetical protein [Flavisolibacter sp.]
MKKSYLLYLLLSFFITSCDKDPDPEPASPFLRVNPQGIALQSTQNATATFAIESNIEWRITLPANDWVQLDHSSGRGNLTVKATATNNTSAIARSLEATIAPVSTSTTAPIKLIISQH